MLNNVLQWTGTVFILLMYVLMNFFRDLQLDALAGLLGGLCYFAWTVRVANMPQMLVNGVAIAIGLAGLYKAWG